VSFGETNPKFRDNTIDIPSQGERKPLFHDCADFGLSKTELDAFAAGLKVVTIVTVKAQGKDVFGRRIHGTDEFIHIFPNVPPNLEEIKMTLGSVVNPEEEDQTG
jgi:hypothetical protein